MTVTEPLVAFLKARLAEDEQLAKAATPGVWQPTETADEEPDRAAVYIDHPTVPGAATGLFEADWGTLADASHIARHDPARVLREVEVKRAIIDLYEEALEAEPPYRSDWDRGYAQGEISALRPIAFKLAAVWSHHPDYREEW